jgi:archaemetzincin
MRVVTLVPLDPATRGSFDHLADALRSAFRTEVRVRAPWFEVDDVFEPSRGQYSSTEILAHLLDAPSEIAADNGKLLGVTGVDLFIPVLTFVFGEAQLDGRAAVVSTHRLRAELYGLLPNPATLRDRLAKEAIHELGHTYGLVHCHVPECVMNSSTYVEEIDLKSSEFCNGCRSVIDAATAGSLNPAVRENRGGGI